jgi:hypothetical protein
MTRVRLLLFIAVMPLVWTAAFSATPLRLLLVIAGRSRSTPGPDPAGTPSDSHRQEPLP